MILALKKIFKFFTYLLMGHKLNLTKISLVYNKMKTIYSNQEIKQTGETVAIIRVGGNLGAGKTTVCKKLAEYLGYRYFNTGGVFREMAKERGLTIEEFYSQIASETTLEKEVDNRQIELMTTGDNLIVEGRIAAFLPCSFKAVNIFLKVSEKEGVSRMLKREENKERSFEEVLNLSRRRVKEERTHYGALYGIKDHLDERKYNIIIDTTCMSPEEAITATIRAITPLL